MLTISTDSYYVHAHTCIGHMDDTVYVEIVLILSISCKASGSVLEIHVKESHEESL